MNLKRKFDKLLAEGQGKQLLWLLVIALVCLTLALLVVRYIFHDGTLGWQDIVAVFLDAGCFGGAGAHDGFRLVLALISTFLFSALLVSMFTNVFENICEGVRNGERRYRLSGHVLILGTGSQLANMVRQLNRNGKTVVVMSNNKPCIDGDFIYYKGAIDDEKDLQSARPDKAEAIYIIGDDSDADHDARGLCCLDLLKELCHNVLHDTHCYLSVHDYLTTEVLQYLKQKPNESHLLVDVVNDNEYQAEQLFVDTPFLPILKQNDSRQMQLFILGTGAVAQAVAYTAAHLCHYPSFSEQGKRTIITFIGEDMAQWRNDLMAARPALFALSHHTLIHDNGQREMSKPTCLPHLTNGTSDFLDIEWQFVDGSETTPQVRQLMEAACTDNYATRIVVCHSNPERAAKAALHLPKSLYAHADIAVYMSNSTKLMQYANQSGLFGQFTFFGPASDTCNDPLYLHRFARGQRVNYIYCQQYKGKDSQDSEAEWYKISEADKYSSIYCANAMYLRKECYAEVSDPVAVYEAEHRRWVMSELLMGFDSGATTDKPHFIHADIVPFSMLPVGEQEKDKILIDNMNYILGKQ